MYPYLFGVEFFSMFFIMIAIGIIGCLALFKYLCGRLKIADKPYNFYSMTALFAIAAGLMGAFLFQQLYNYIEHLKTGQPFEWRGITFYGGLIAGVLSFVLITVFFADRETKKDFWLIANIAAPCIALAHMCGRFGCFFAGCCYGKESEHGIIFPDHTIKVRVIPTNLYEALFLGLLTVVLLVLLLKYKKSSFLIILYAYAYAVFRFIIEFYRGDSRGEFLPVLSPSQWWSVAIVIFVSALCVAIYKFKKVPFSKLASTTSTQQGSEQNPSEASDQISASSPATNSAQIAQNDNQEIPEQEIE